MKMFMMSCVAVLMLIAVAEAQKISVAGFRQPPATAVQDTLFVEMNFKVESSSGELQGLFTTDIISNSILSGGSKKDDTNSRMIANALIFDVAQSTESQFDAISIRVKSQNDLQIRIETEDPEQAHIRLVASVQSGEFLLRSRRLFLDVHGDDFALSVEGISQIFRYRTEIVVELVDNMGGFGSGWAASDILVAGTSSALRTDVANVILLRGKDDAQASQDVFLHRADDLTNAGARRVSVIIALEANATAFLLSRTRALQGRFPLPLTTHSLQRLLGVQSLVDGVCRDPNAHPERGFCGPGCAVPSLLCFSVFFASIITLYVAWGGKNAAKENVAASPAGQESRLPALPQK